MSDAIDAVGDAAELERVVASEDTADAYGNVGVHVLGTPALVGWLEDVALAALTRHLRPGQHSVGTRVDIEHLAPTPVGERVRLHAVIDGWQGRRVRFIVEARDGHETIARGRHERFVVDADRFARRVERKA